MKLTETIKNDLTEEKLRRLNRELQAISRCNKILLRAEDEVPLLEDICRIICDVAGYRMAWIGYPENDAAKTIRAVAWSGFEDGYLRQARLSWADTLRGRGPAGTAIRTGKTACIQDFNVDPEAAPWCAAALQRGYRSTIALPLKDNCTTVFGVLLIYSTEAHAFTTDESRLLEELAGDLASGILMLRARKVSEQSERRIALLSFALNSVHEAAFLIDRSARFHYVNEESCRGLGYTRDELLELYVPDVNTECSMERWASHWDELKTERSLTLEERHRSKDGSVFPVEINANYLEYNGQEFALTLVRDISERKRLERESLLNLRYFESMDRFNRTIQGARDLDGMMSEALDVVLSIFDCDRAFLLYPCDPEADSWNVPMERCKPEYPGLHALGLVMPMNEEIATAFRTLLDADGPVKFGPGSDIPLPERIKERFDIRSMISMVIYPKVGKPWQFGIHQCSYPRIWSPEEERLFQAVGRRIADSLTSLVTFRDLQKSEMRYRRIVDTANEGIWMLDEDLKTSFVNARMADMLGYGAVEMIGLPLAYFVCEADLPDHVRRMDNRRQGISEHYERCFRHKSGYKVWALVSAVPVLDEKHLFNGSFAMLTDITEKKFAEEELYLLNEDLEKRVHNRTQELQMSNAELENAYRDLQTAHSQILQQEKMASIGQLASGIAHEINTPTQFVGSNISFLRESFGNLLQAMDLCQDLLLKAENEQTIDAFRQTLRLVLELADLEFMKTEVLQALKESEDGVNRIAKIVTAMKDFAHPGGTSPQPMELNPLIKSTIEICRNEWKLVARLETDLDPSLPIVAGIRDELGQVVLNLLVNAAHAVADGSCTNGQGLIRVVTRRSDNWVEIVVQDNGCGIPKELQQKIFEPFFTTKKVGRGSGQGLAIAYHIVSGKHHGKLLVDSEPGKSTTFTVQLPIMKSAKDMI